jgi:hypothetical protein
LKIGTFIKITKTEPVENLYEILIRKEIGRFFADQFYWEKMDIKFKNLTEFHKFC